MRVTPRGGAPSDVVVFTTTEDFGFDAEASTQGGKVRLTNNNRTAVSSGGTAAAVGNLGFSRGRVTFMLVVEVRPGLSACACWDLGSVRRSVLGSCAPADRCGCVASVWCVASRQNDEPANRSVCYGVSTRPIADPFFGSSSSLVVLRASNSMAYKCVWRVSATSRALLVL